jgi:glycerol uptake facilitator-like aquaporin
MLRRKLTSEFLGTATLLATVIGSGAMAVSLSSDIGIQLLINTIATVFILYIIITLLGPISGAHFNPVVTAVDYFTKKMKAKDCLLYIIAQLAGAAVGAIVANLMFDLKAINISQHQRSGANLLLAEVIATAGLILIIHLALKQKEDKKIPRLVAAWIGAAYFFTSSTSFANPAAVFGRMFSDTFSGIAPKSAPLFILAEILGGLLGYLGFKTLTSQSKSPKAKSGK